MARIIVDHREKRSGIIKELAKRKIDVEVQQLITADFIIETKDSNKVIHNVGIEKKTQADFLNSIIDKRLIKQLIMLKENFSIPLIIIEGSDNIYTVRNFHPNAIRGMLAAIAIDFQIPILHTKNYRDTAALLEIISRRLENPKKHFSLLKKRKPVSLKEQQEFLVESLPGVGALLAKSLLKKFKSVKKIMNASEKRLQSIEKIGKKKAKDIKDAVEKEYE
tara:strand:+ start:15520 stop:16182 length:663 start_codon:yes stop_codon:yes gene_type:complete